MSIYKEYLLQPSIPHQCMHYSEKNGDRCRSRAMHNEIMCFQHRVDDIPTVLQNDPFELASLYDRAAIQRAVTEIAGRLAANHMDLKRAALLLQSCQIAASNLTAHDRAAVNAQKAPAPLAPPSAELNPNPDPEALRREQSRRAEIGLDDLPIVSSAPAPSPVSHAKHQELHQVLAIPSEPPAPTPKLVTLSDPELVEGESKDPETLQTTSTAHTILATSNPSGLPPVFTRSVQNSTKCHAKRPTEHEVPREASRTARSAAKRPGRYEYRSAKHRAKHRP
jgi:hypothetical protein